jgi:hypothetical protein
MMAHMETNDLERRFKALRAKLTERYDRADNRESTILPVLDAFNQNVLTRMTRHQAISPIERWLALRGPEIVATAEKVKTEEWLALSSEVADLLEKVNKQVLRKPWPNAAL